MLSNANVTAAQAENYYEKDDYYTKGDSRIQSNSQWQGKGAEQLHLEGPVQQAQFQQLLRGQTPEGKSLHARPIDPAKHRAGTDYTFSAPKSVSIAALIQKDTRVIAAHDRAVQVALEVLEERYAQTRVRRGPALRENVQTGNVIAATFRHETSREQDPQLHTHCVVVNATQLANGKWQSMRNDEALNNIKFLGQVYRNELAHQLRQIGYVIEPQGNGLFECKGYNEDLRAQFSTRSQQIESYVEKWETAIKEQGGKPLHSKQKKQATLATRLRKKTVPREVLLEGWERAITERALTLPELPKQTTKSRIKEPSELLRKAAQKGGEIAAQEGIAHAAERESVFKREKAERFALENHVGEQTFRELQGAMSAVGLLPAKNRYTTTEAIEREQATIALMESGKGQVDAITRATEVLMLTTQEHSLTAGQYSAILKSATSRDQFIGWQGVAGAGKTYSLKLLSQLAAENGYAVSGYAPSAQAAAVLAQEANIEGSTVARLLLSQQSEQGRQRSDRTSIHQQKPLWIVDEAGLLSAKDAHALLTKATQQNARVILVGDTKQLSAVEAGNPFKSLQIAGIQTCYLEESRRQKTEALRAAVVCMAAGEAKEGLQRLETAGMVQQIAEPHKRRQRIIGDYMRLLPKERDKTLILAGTNVERLELTQSIRAALQQEGTLGQDAYLISSLRQLDRTEAQLKYVSSYEEDDVVVSVKDYRRYGMQRRVPYRVVERDLENNLLTLAAPDGRTFSFDPTTCTTKTTYTVQELAISVGDKLRWTRNEAVKGVRNGQQVTVEAIDRDGTATLRTDKGEQLQTNLQGHQYLDYALVSTTYSAQGKTADTVLVSADSTLSKEGLNVAVTRAKYRLSLYSADTEELYKRAERSSAKENPSDYLPLFKLVRDDAQNPEAAHRRSELRSVDRAEPVGSDTGAVVAQSCRTVVRRDREAASRDSQAERTAGSIDRRMRADAAESYRSFAAARTEVERTVAQRSQQLERQQVERIEPSTGAYGAVVTHWQERSQQGDEQASSALERLNRLVAEQQREQSNNEEQQAEQQRYYDLYYQFANEVGGGVDVQDQDRRVAKRLLNKMLRVREGQPLTREDKALAENIMQQSPEAKRIEKTEGREASQDYAISVLREAKHRIVSEQLRQQKKAKQKERGGMEP